MWQLRNFKTIRPAYTTLRDSVIHVRTPRGECDKQVRDVGRGVAAGVQLDVNALLQEVEEGLHAAVKKNERQHKGQQSMGSTPAQVEQSSPQA